MRKMRRDDVGRRSIETMTTRMAERDLKGKAVVDTARVRLNGIATSGRL